MHLKLRHKINYAIVITFLMIALLFVAIQIPTQQHRRDRAIQRIEILLKTLVERDMEQLANEIFDARLKAIHMRIEEMRSVPGILNIDIFDTAGKLLVTNDSILSPKKISSGEIEQIRKQIQMEPTKWKGQDALIFSKEIHFLGEQLGFIRIYHSLMEIEKDQQTSFLIFGGLLTVTLVVMLIVLNLILSKAILSPIMNLRDAARAIAMGNLKKNITIFQRDELGDLAESFEKMRNSINGKIFELQRITSIIESTTDLVCMASPDLKVIYLNKSGRKMVGLDETESLGDKQVADYYSKRASATIQNGMRTAIEAGTWEGETSLIGPDGNEFPVSQVIICHFDPNKNIEYLSTIIRDISEQKKAAKALLESEKHLRLLTDNMVDIISQTDANLNLIYVSPSLERILGHPPSNFLGKSLIDWLHPEDRERSLKQAAEARQKRLPSILLEYRWRHENGHYLWIESATRLLYDEAGNSKGAIFASRDISEKKAYEKQLIRFATIIEQASEEVLITDIEGTIQYINPSFEKNTGYAKNELLGQKPSILKSGMHDPLFYQDLWETILDKKTWKGFIHNRTKNGQIILHDVRIMPILNAKQNISTFVSIRRNITEQTKMEQQLRQSQKMEAIGTLAGGVAHDFNNILSGIFGYADLAVVNLNDTDKVERYIEQITVGARRAADLVQQILTFSRKTEHRKSAVKLYLIVKETIKFLRSSIPSNIEIKEKISTSSVAIVDPTQFHQIIMNLCTNAFHSMEKTGGTLSIALEDIEISESKSIPDIGIKPGNYIRMEISDTGSGMSSDTLTRIFEPYFTTKGIGEGTGLGLAVVLGIVEEHKGVIKAYSELGKGSTFNVYLPVSKNHEGIDRFNVKKPVIKMGTERIMVVDDDHDILTSTREILENHGYTVVEFGDGESAFNAFKKDPDQFDLIVTDITMPRMTGDALSREILKIRNNIPIILCSGYSRDYSKDKISKMGTLKYLQKPVDSQDLLTWIRDLLEKK